MAATQTIEASNLQNMTVPQLQGIVKQLGRDGRKVEVLGTGAGGRIKKDDYLTALVPFFGGEKKKKEEEESEEEDEEEGEGSSSLKRRRPEAPSQTLLHKKAKQQGKATYSRPQPQRLAKEDISSSSDDDESDTEAEDRVPLLSKKTKKSQKNQKSKPSSSSSSFSSSSSSSSKPKPQEKEEDLMPLVLTDRILHEQVVGACAKAGAITIAILSQGPEQLKAIKAASPEVRFTTVRIADSSLMPSSKKPRKKKSKSKLQVASGMIKACESMDRKELIQGGVFEGWMKQKKLLKISSLEDEPKAAKRALKMLVELGIIQVEGKLAKFQGREGILKQAQKYQDPCVFPEEPEEKEIEARALWHLPLSRNKMPKSSFHNLFESYETKKTLKADINAVAQQLCHFNFIRRNQHGDDYNFVKPNPAVDDDSEHEEGEGEGEMI